MTLHKKFNSNQTSRFNNVFAKEIRVLSIILLTFCASYFIRFVSDVFYVTSISTKPCMDNILVPVREVQPVNFDDVIYLLTVPVIYDIIPIGSLFLFHKRNFTIQNKPVPKSTQSQEATIAKLATLSLT